MEKARNDRNIWELFQLIRATSSQKPTVSETIKDNNVYLISGKEDRIDHWAEYLEDQFSWPTAATPAVDSPFMEPWSVNLEVPLISEVEDCISAQKCHQAPGRDNIPPALSSRMDAKPSVNV